MRTSRGLLLAGLIMAGVASPNAAPIPTDASALAWMAGSWTGTKNGVEIEELWLAPKGQTMLSVHRDVKDGKTASFEFLRIEETPAGLTYWASPGGKPATPFHCVELTGKKVVFASMKLKFPSRVLYWLDEEGSLHAKIEGTIRDQPASEEWTWRKTP